MKSIFLTLKTIFIFWCLRNSEWVALVSCLYGLILRHKMLKAKLWRQKLQHVHNVHNESGKFPLDVSRSFVVFRPHHPNP